MSRGPGDIAAAAAEKCRKSRLGLEDTESLEPKSSRQVLEGLRSLGQPRVVLGVREVGDIIPLRIGREGDAGAFQELEQDRVRVDVLDWFYDYIVLPAPPLVVPLLAGTL